jgi:hypothetical protein
MNDIPLCPHCVSGGEMVNVTCEADTCPVYLCHACNLLVSRSWINCRISRPQFTRPADPYKGDRSGR